MKKAVIVVGVVVGLAALARRAGCKMGSLDWEKAFERMPDNAPPKWMFQNISAIRENTQRSLELLQQQAASGPEDASSTTTE
jgi:hypothetical protein